MSIVCLLSSIFFEPTTATAQILFVLGVLHELKTTWTRLVWRTRPCGTEVYVASRHREFSLFSVQVWVKEAATFVSSSVKKKRSFSRAFSTCRQRQGFRPACDRGCPNEAPDIALWTSFNYKVLPVLSESTPYSLLSRILNVFLTPKLWLGHLELVRSTILQTPWFKRAGSFG